MLNAGLLMEMLETDTLEVVTFLIMRVCVSLLPTATDPYDTDDGVEVKGRAPVPLNETVSNTTPLLLLRVRVPVIGPDAVGVNPIAK